jgi:hypothetical protein
VARFEPGHRKVPGSGRKKGQLSRATLLRVDAYCIERGVEPVEEIYKLLTEDPSLEAKDRLKGWFELLSYCQPKPRPETEAPPPSGVPENVPEAVWDAIDRAAAKEKSSDEG